MREGGLLRWQWSLYPEAHRDRRNLALHALTAPLFLAGTLLLFVKPWIGLPLMLVALVAQGRGHKLEKTAPAPFEGPLDVPKRFFAEQFVTFPRYVLSGEFARAWRRAD